MKELLVPVGNMESLIVALHAGADAVYLGGKRFGARAFATNFNDDEMCEAIKLTHLYGAKIYVTVNTLIYESELLEALDYLKFLHINGVDAVIVQDIGLISLARKVLPNLEIHASTQVHNTNSDGLKILSDLGVKRVVLARELSLDEINNIDTDMEKEVFIHGALCICYSGECLFSSMLMNRSGNRGECAQMCRLPFKLLRNDTVINTDGSYLLSTKELNTSSEFINIMNSDIKSLKIEGRMKSPEYVGCVTSLYRDLLDKYNNGEQLIVNKEILRDLSVIFNRDFTTGFLNNATNKELMNIKSSNHIGISLGRIVDVSKKYISVKLDCDIRQGDGIRFNRINEGMIANYIMDKKGNLINSATSGNVIMFDNKYHVKVGDTINKTIDVTLVDKYRNINNKFINLNFKLVEEDNELLLFVSDGNNEVSVRYGVVSDAINSPTTEERITEQLSKLGGTPFKVENIDINIRNNAFINIKDLNELRRQAIDKITDIRRNVKVDVVINDIKEENIAKDYIHGISVLCRTDDQVRAALDMKADRIYIPDRKLYSEYKYYNNVYFRTYRVNDRTKKLDNVLTTELGALYRLGGIGDYYLNVANHQTINYLLKYAKMLTLSVELDDNEITNILNNYKSFVPLEVIVYSNIELMITKYCPLNMLANDKKICSVCSDRNKYYLLDRNNKKFRILNDVDVHLTHIMDHKPTNRIYSIDLYKSIGIKNYRIELLDENYHDSLSIIKEVISKVGDTNE